VERIHQGLGYTRSAVRTLRRFSAFFAAGAFFAVALAACGDNALGSETAGKSGLPTTFGFKASLVSPEKRRPHPRFGGEAVRRDAPPVDSSMLRSRIGVVNFWGSWCAPCRREERMLESVWKQYRERGVRFIGVNVLDSRGDANVFLDEFGVTYPSVFNRDASIAFKFRVLFMPSTFVIDRHGRIAATIKGALRNRLYLTRVLDQLLNEP
jgi:thiol-disulfide isomerase/thioredoxin